MAIVKNSHIEKISGKVGSEVYANTRKGNVLKAFPKINRKSTPARSKIGELLITASRAHRRISYDQYLAWAQFTKGETHINKVDDIAPYDWRDIFQKLNMNRLLINEPLFLDPPKSKIIPKLFHSVTIKTYYSNRLEDIRIFFKPKINKDTKYILYATFLLGNGIFNPKDSAYKYFAVIDHTFHSGSSIFNQYMEYFKGFKEPPPIATRYMIGFYFRAVSISSGRSSGFIKVMAVPDPNS